MSAEIFSTTGFGVPAGAKMPNHAPPLSFAIPSSGNVGTSGSARERAAAATASGRILPALIWGSAVPIELKPAVIWPPSRSVRISASPL